MRFLLLPTLVASLASALPSYQQLSARDDAATPVFAADGWIEVIAARSNGELLLPYTHKPELWSLNPQTNKTTKIATFPNAWGLTGITEVSHDFWAVSAGNFSTTNFTLQRGSWSVWTVDLRGKEPKTTFVKQIPGSGFFIGSTPLGHNNIMIADAGQGILFKMNVLTGDYSVISNDTSMSPNGGLAGIHGVHWVKGHAYYTNTFGGGFWKIKVDHSGKAIGAPTQIAPFTRPEDFAFTPDGSAYAGMMTGGIWKISPDGNVTKFVDVEPPTSVVFGRGKNDKSVLYISTAKGDLFKATVPGLR
jgi:hypothetical protein